MTTTKHGTGPVPRRPVVDLYARLSRCPDDGSLEKVDTQLGDCRAVAERNGWTVGQQHRDNSLSAWRRGVRRPGWEALLARLESGETDGVLVWHTDRLLRQPRDLERLIDLGDQRGVLLASAYGEHNLGNSDHRLALRINAATACKSSDDTSRRLKRRFATMREAGRMTGRARAFGFPGGDRTAAKGADGKLPPVPAEQVERERAALRQATADVLAGLPLAGVVRGWNEQGLRTATGEQWTASTVRAVLTRGCNAGYVEHEGRTVGRSDDVIVDPEEFERLRAVFASRRRGRTPGDVYVGSGIARCGQCGKPLSGRPHTGTYPGGEPRRQYCCSVSRGGCGKVAADQRKVDVELERFTVTRLSDDRHAALVDAAHAEAADRLAAIERELGEARTVHDGLGDRLGRGEVSLAAFDAAMGSLLPRLARLEAERAELAAVAPAGPVDGAKAEQTVRAEWADADVPRRRAMLRRALEPDAVLYLDPAKQRGGVWDPTRVYPTRWIGAALGKGARCPGTGDHGTG